jgi:hypothetical protein
VNVIKPFPDELGGAAYNEGGFAARHAAVYGQRRDARKYGKAAVGRGVGFSSFIHQPGDSAELAANKAEALVAASKAAQ